MVPSIHGHTAELHEKLVRVPGAFEQTVNGIKNMVSENLYTLSDTVIVKQNYGVLPEITKFLFGLGVNQVQLSFVHPMGNALKNFDDVIPNISDIEKPLKTAVGIADGLGKTLTTEGVPLCFLKGMESHAIESMLPETEIESEDLNQIRKVEEKRKSANCEKCKKFRVCEGIWNEYAEKRGLGELKPY
jgi:MoaA/NifB/PqqE/SkfB family radical SAM enzyme